MNRANIGCGRTAIPGWYNFDNSPSVRLARHALLVRLLEIIGVLKPEQVQFIRDARTLDIRWADATRRIPLPDGSLEVIYSSHMLEHLDREDVKRFLREVRRLLAVGGILRLSVPDLDKMVKQYIVQKDADAFLDRMNIAPRRPRGFLGKVKFSLTGVRHHQWMYDADSLLRLVQRHGFINARIMAPGETGIVSPGELNLFERADTSITVEAFK